MEYLRSSATENHLSEFTYNLSEFTYGCGMLGGRFGPKLVSPPALTPQTLAGREASVAEILAAGLPAAPASPEVGAAPSPAPASPVGGKRRRSAMEAESSSESNRGEGGQGAPAVAGGEGHGVVI